MCIRDRNGGAEILYPEQPAAELPDWAAEGMEKFGIPELSGEQTLPEQSQTSPQNQAGDEAAQALIQLLLDQGDITPEEAAELTNQGEKRIQIPDWDYGEPEELVSCLLYTSPDGTTFAEGFTIYASCDFSYGLGAGYAKGAFTDIDNCVTEDVCRCV